MTVKEAIAKARETYPAHGYVMVNEDGSTWQLVCPADMTRRQLARSERIAYALRLLGVDEYEAEEVAYQPGTWIDLVRNHVS